MGVEGQYLRRASSSFRSHGTRRRRPRSAARETF